MGKVLNVNEIKLIHLFLMVYTFCILLKKVFPNPRKKIVFHIGLKLCDLHFKPLILYFIPYANYAYGIK